MSKITCISDVHLNHFKSHEFYKGFRDEQFLRAARRTVEISKENESNVLCILGDTIDTPVIVPSAFHLLIEFFNILTAYYEKIYIIKGQHDEASKIINWAEEDSFINVLPKIFDKIEYVDNKVINILGRNIYFRDWTPREVINDVPQCDMFFGHVTLDERFGQVIEPANYKLGLFGDIHSIKEMGKNHSVGGFLQKDMRDTPYGNVCIVDPADCSFKRVHLINSENKFLRIYNEGEEENVDEYTVINHKDNRINAITLKDIDESGNSQEVQVKLSELDNVIISRLEKYELLDIHKEVQSKCVIKDLISFDFKIKRLVVDNFRSIKHCEIDFDKYDGLLYISGNNGSGKTSIINALYYALVGDMFINKFLKKHESSLSLDVTLIYNNLKYRIVRKTGACEFYINDERISKNNKRDLEKHIVACLPFLTHLSVFYVRAKSNYAGSFFNSNLINRIFGIDNIVQYFNRSTEMLKETVSKIKTINLDISKLTGSLEALNSQLTSDEGLLAQKQSELDSYDQELFKVSDKIEYLRNRKQELATKLANLQVDANFDEARFNELVNSESDLVSANRNNSNIDNLKSQLATINSSIESIKASLVVKKCPNCGTVLSSNEEAVNAKIKGFEDRRIKIQDDLSKLSLIDVEPIKARIVEYKSLKSKIDMIQKYKFTKTELDNINSELMQYSKYEAISTSDMKENKFNITSAQRSIDDLNRRIQNDKDSISKTTGQLNDLKVTFDELSTRQTKLSLYSELFSPNSEKSLYKEVKLKISESLSDEEVTLINQNVEEGQLGLQLKVDNEWMDYNACSCGQQTYVDLKLISKLFTIIDGSGLLILDEMLANVDVSKLDPCLTLIRSFDCKNVIMTSHNSEIKNDFDSQLHCELVDNCTIIT